MISTNLGVAVALGLLAGGPHDHRRPARGGCDGCGAATAPVLREIQVLRASPKEDDREDAAEDLRKFDWRRHPEAVLALCDALVGDRSDDVREEAAESLGKMGACVPEAHEALGRAAAYDRDGGVRREARKALGSLGRRCIAECRACGPIPGGGGITGPSVVILPDWLPYLAPGTIAGPSTDPAPAPEPQLEPLPPAIPDASGLPDVPPPFPTPTRVEGPVGARAPRPIRSTVRVR